MDPLCRDVSRAVPARGQAAEVVLSFIRLLGCKLRKRGFGEIHALHVGG